jgi:mono/diheme cytochrome c family protein
MGKFLVGLIIGILAFPVLLGLYFFTGSVPAAVSDRAFPLERLIAGGALDARISKEAPKRDLSSFTKEDLVAGAQVYRRSECMECHGGPPQFGQPETHVLYPPAPLLFTPDGTVTDDPVGVSYWKVKNGIRLSGMPSYKDQLTDQELWQVAALVASADKLPPEAFEPLKPPVQSAVPPPASAPATPAGKPAK